MRTIIDTVLTQPDGPGVRIDGAVPIGLLAPICFQPHVGDDREQVFAVEGEEGARRLVWRTSTKAEHQAGVSRFLIVPLRRESWIAMLDRDISVPRALGDADRGITVRLGRVMGGAGITEVVPAPELSDALGATGLPDEYTFDEATGARQPRRSSWLALPTGRLVDPSRNTYADDIAELERWRSAGSPARTVTTSDGRRVDAFGDAVVTTAADGTEVVTRYGQQLTARVVVEREALR